MQEEQASGSLFQAPFFASFQALLKVRIATLVDDIARARSTR
jgi:hypothetical protein